MLEIRFPWDSEPPGEKAPPALPAPPMPPAEKPRGRRPIAATQAKPQSPAAISDWVYHRLTFSGPLRWMVLDGAIKAPVLIRFLQRLIRDARRKVFLILDRLRVHRAVVVRDWLAKHKGKIEISYLPSYSPDP
jgi:DDE superfamily endonuclease